MTAPCFQKYPGLRYSRVSLAAGLDDDALNDYQHSKGLSWACALGQDWSRMRASSALENTEISEFLCLLDLEYRLITIDQCMTPTPLAPPGRNHPSGGTPVWDPQWKVRRQMNKLGSSGPDLVLETQVNVFELSWIVMRFHGGELCWYQCQDAGYLHRARFWFDLEHVDPEFRIILTNFDNVQRVT